MSGNLAGMMSVPRGFHTLPSGFARRVVDYAGETSIGVPVDPGTSGVSPRQRRQTLDEWARFFSEPTRITDLYLTNRVTDAHLQLIENQTGMQRLRLKWGPYTDLTSLERMSQLHSLYLGGASALTDLSPLAALPALTHLVLENSRRVHDYSPLANVPALEHLSVHPGMTGSRSTANSLEFLRSLPHLREFFWDPRVDSLDYRPMLSLTSATAIGVRGEKGMRPTLLDLEWALPGMRESMKRRDEQRIPLIVDGTQVGDLTTDIAGHRIIAPPAPPDTDPNLRFGEASAL